MHIGEAIRTIRKELNIPQNKFAEACGLSQTTMSQIENGIKRPGQRTIGRICAAYAIPEVVIYIVAMQETDVCESKRAMYHALYPSLKGLALQLMKSDNAEMGNSI